MFLAVAFVRGFFFSFGCDDVVCASLGAAEVLVLLEAGCACPQGGVEVVGVDCEGAFWGAL